MDLQFFREWLLVNGNSQASAETHCDKVSSFFHQYEAFTQENLNSFLASKIDKWCGNSFNLSINAFNHYAKFLKLEIEIPKYHKSDSRIKEYLEKKEFDDILIKIPLIFENGLKVQVILELMYFTGLRPKEIINLKRADINLQEKYLIICNTKVKRDKKIVLANSICNLLPILFNQEPEKINALNITRTGLGYIFRTITKQMDLKKNITPYTMRTSFAKFMLKKGLSLTSLQSAMNHKNVASTLTYLRTTEEDANKQILNILNNKKK